MQRLTCREFVEFLSDYLAGELPPETAARFDEHLSRCPPCVRYLRTFRASGELARAALGCRSLHELPPGLLAAIRSARKQGL